MPPDWSIGVMAYNEAETIGEVLARLVETLPALANSFEILVVDDGSSDATASVVREWSRRHPEIHLLEHQRNLGIGRTLKDAYCHSRGQWVAVLPADLQFDPRDLARLAPYLRDSDVINVLRLGRSDSWRRKALTAADRMLTRLLFGLTIRDLHWVKVYRRWLLDKIEIDSDSPLVDTELLIKASRLGARILEVPLPHYPRRAGASRAASLSNIVKSLRDLVKLRLSLKR